MGLICNSCKNDWYRVGKEYKRKNSDKIDYKCSFCGSKQKPVFEEPTENSIEKINDTRDKKILVISDLHCGHYSGLTPPDWWSRKQDIQKECWEFYVNTTEKIGYIDALVLNGDGIEGKGSRSGGSELLTADLFEQSKMAEHCIKQVKFGKLFMTYGTPYHTSDGGTDFELGIANRFNGIIKDHLWLDVNGCIFDFKHKIAGSSVLQSRVGALIKEYIWNLEWHNIDGAPKSDVFIRSHVHYHMSVKDPNTFLGMTTPALQAPDTKFGGRQCSGTVHFGMILFEIPENYKDVDDVKFTVFKKHLKTTKSRSYKI